MLRALKQLYLPTPIGIPGFLGFGWTRKRRGACAPMASQLRCREGVKKTGPHITLSNTTSADSQVLPWSEKQRAVFFLLWVLKSIPRFLPELSIKVAILCFQRLEADLIKQCMLEEAQDLKDREGRIPEGVMTKTTKEEINQMGQKELEELIRKAREEYYASMRRVRCMVSFPARWEERRLQK